MGGSQPPFMYQTVSRDDERFPAVKFDPKAVTRASYESKKPKPKPDGPLVSFNRHPDALMVPNGRKQKYSPMGQRTKSWIKGMRVVQMCLRVVQAIAAVGLIVAMSVSGLVGWVVIATCAIVILHCIYSVFHHVRPAGARTPGSSAGYQFFAGLSDLCVLPLYAYGAIMTRNKNEEWKTTAPPDDPDVVKYMVPSVFYGLIGAGGLHLISLAISLWLGLMFRRIAYMPPDMNPLEANLTSRVHKRNKSSVTTTSTYSDEKRESELYDDSSSRPPSVPFMHTRRGSDLSLASGDSRLNLPSRQYQVPASDRNSTTSEGLKRMSAPPPPAHRASYTEIPLGETGASSSRPVSVHSSRPSTGSVPSYRAEPVSPAQTVQPRSARFTETWYASESLINRTQQRNRATPTPQKNKTKAAYVSLDASDGENNSDSENDTFYTPARGNTTTNDENHPNPLRSNPLATTNPNTTTTNTNSPRRPRTPFSRLRNSVLSTLSPNDRRVSGSQDITDQTQTQPQTKAFAVGGGGGGPRNRLSSIQPDGAFFSKPYGELRAATPPVLVGGNEGRERVVSSGNDYDLGSDGGVGVGAMARRVSGKVAEEGRAGQRWSRYGVLNE